MRRGLRFQMALDTASGRKGLAGWGLVGVCVCVYLRRIQDNAGGNKFKITRMR